MNFLKIFLISLVLFSDFSYGEITEETNEETKKDKNITSKLSQELVILGKTLFKVINLKTKEEEIIDLTGKDFILISVREHGSDGRFYSVDKDGTAWWSGPVTSGASEFRSPSGVFSIFQKKRFHMSTKYPDENGINNMDYMMKFTRYGHALHKGSVDWMSHGCIHIDPKDVPTLFKWADYKTPVVITRHSYMPFAKEDLKKIYDVR